MIYWASSYFFRHDSPFEWLLMSVLPNSATSLGSKRKLVEQQIAIWFAVVKFIGVWDPHRRSSKLDCKLNFDVTFFEMRLQSNDFELPLFFKLLTQRSDFPARYDFEAFSITICDERKSKGNPGTANAVINHQASLQSMKIIQYSIECLDIALMTAN